MTTQNHIEGGTLRIVTINGKKQDGGGGNDGGSIPPVDNTARLDQLDTRMTSVEAKLGHVDSEVSNLKWWLLGSVVTIILTTVGTVIGTGIGIQQMTVATFQAAGQQNAPQQPTVIVLPAAAAASR